MGAREYHCDDRVLGPVVDLTKYTVTCFSPGISSPVSEGDDVEVEGTGMGNDITAKQIKNRKTKVTCRCGAPTFKTSLARTNQAISETKKRAGKVTNVIVDKEFVQFELNT